MTPTRHSPSFSRLRASLPRWRGGAATVAARTAGIVLVVLLLAACGFHLRQSVALPPEMQRVVVHVDGDAVLQRQLAVALKAAGASVEEDGGAGIAELAVPVARFDTRALTVNGYATVSEYTVTYHVEFHVIGADGQPLLTTSALDMSREFTYDRSQALGTATREEQIRKSLVDDMVQAILRRVQAANTP